MGYDHHRQCIPYRYYYIYEEANLYPIGNISPNIVNSIVNDQIERDNDAIATRGIPAPASQTTRPRPGQHLPRNPVLSPIPALPAPTMDSLVRYPLRSSQLPFRPSQPVQNGNP